MKKIKKNFLVISNYNNDLSWVPEYTDNYLIYNKRSDKVKIPDTIDPKKIIQGSICGYNSYEYFTYIIENYENLPECIIFAKGWTFPRHIRKERFDKIMNNDWFTPIEDWEIYETKFPVSFISSDGGLCEINSSWYMKRWKNRYFTNCNDFLRFLYKNPVIPLYTRFSPGGDCIVPRENILKVPKVVYQNLRLFMSHDREPAETHMIERTIFTLWNSNFEFNPKILKPLDESFEYRNKKSETFSRKIYFFFCKIIANVFAGNIKKAYNGLFTKIKHKIISILKTRKNLFLSREQKTLSKEEVAEIKQYREKIKIYDIFSYNGESEMLDMRLNILYEHVDQFIIIESRTTFSGLHKPLYFERDQKKFEKFSKKIKYFILDEYLEDQEICDLADKSPNIRKNGPEHWKREFYQRESIKKALVGLRDDDICFIGDVDEIWNTETIVDYRKDDLYKLRQIVYAYYLNNRSSEPWAGTMVTKYKNIKNSCLNHLRTIRMTPYTYVKNAGWHFTSMGGIEELRRKINDSYTSESYNTDRVQKNLEKDFGNRDYLGRKFIFTIDEENLPTYLKENKEKYKHLFK